MNFVLEDLKDIEKFNPYFDLYDEYFENEYIAYFNNFSSHVNLLKEKLNHEYDKEIDKCFKECVKKRNDFVLNDILSSYNKSNGLTNEENIEDLKNKIRILKHIILFSESADMKRLQKVDKLVGKTIDKVSLSYGVDEEETANKLLDDFYLSSDFTLEENYDSVVRLKDEVKKLNDYYRLNYSLKLSTKYIESLNKKVNKKLDYCSKNFNYYDRAVDLINELVNKYNSVIVDSSNYVDWVDSFKSDVKLLSAKFDVMFSFGNAKKLNSLLDNKTSLVIDSKVNLVKFDDLFENRLQMLFDNYKPEELDIFDIKFYKSEDDRDSAYKQYQSMNDDSKHVFEMRIYEQYIRNFKAKIRDYNKEIRCVYSFKSANKMIALVNKRADKLIRVKAKEIGKPVPRNPWFIRKYLWADTENFISKRGLSFRKVINPFMRILVRVAMKNKYIIEERAKLDPTKQYIFVSTHYFTEDIISLYSSVGRQVYMLMGTTDQIENNFLMLAAIMLGLFYVDREDKVSRSECIAKQNKIIDLGCDVVNYVGGSWENSENELQPLSFSGPYKSSVAKGVEIVPVSFYLVRESKEIYIRYGEPMNLSNMDEKNANDIIRDTLASMHYKQMEKHSVPIDSVDIPGYGKTHNLPYDQHIYYMDQVGNEYWNQYWSKPFAKEEIGLRPKKVVEEADVYSFVDNLSREKLIELSSQISEPMLRRYERDERYNIIKYIDENYEKFKNNNVKSKIRKKKKEK